MNVLCSAKACPVLLSTTCVFYEGENLIYTGINTNDNLQEALQKIDETIGNTFLAFVPLSRTITINGVTQDLSANRTWTIPSNNIYNSDGTLTGNRIVTVNDKQLVFRSNPTTTLQNYTFTIGTPTGVPPSTWPSSVIFEGEYLMTTANAEPYNTRVWGRNQSASSRAFYVNQVFADVTSESTGGTNIYNQVFLTRRGSPLDTSTTATGQMRGVWNQVGHVYSATIATPATITTTNQEVYYAQSLNFTGNITNVVGYYAQNQTGYGGTPLTTNITNYYGFFQYSIVVDTKSTITNHYGVFLNTPLIGTGGTIINRWGIYAPDIATRHYFNGNVLLGTTIDTGLYKLDVNGAARVSGALKLFSGATAPANNYPLNAYASSGGIASFEYETTGFLQFVRAGASAGFISLSRGEIYDIALIAGNFGSTLGLAVRPAHIGGVKIGGDNTTIVHENSAMLNVESTTKGFLQPRMTTVERNAIASPATGLQVYNTTTNTNDYYNGTSWSALASGNIYTANGTLTGNRVVTLGTNTLTFTSSINSGLYSSAIFDNTGVTANRVIINHSSNTGFGLSIANSLKWSTASYLPSGGTNYSYVIYNDQIIGTAGNAIFIHGATNNISLGGISDAGFRLDVQGTTRVSGKITANGSSTSTSGLDVGTIRFQNFATNNSFIAENTFYNGSAFERVNTGLASVFYFAGGGFLVGTLPIGTAGTTQASLNVRMSLTNTGSLAISDTISGGGSITHVASAVLQADSTTKGFLPPRMTNTQRTAIATPAVGLMVYCTDSVEGYYVYTSLGWKSLTMV